MRKPERRLVDPGDLWRSRIQRADVDGQQQSGAIEEAVEAFQDSVEVEAGTVLALEMARSSSPPIDTEASRAMRAQQEAERTRKIQERDLRMQERELRVSTAAQQAQFHQAMMQENQELRQRLESVMQDARRRDEEVRQLQASIRAMQTSPRYSDTPPRMHAAVAPVHMPPAVRPTMFSGENAREWFVKAEKYY